MNKLSAFLCAMVLVFGVVGKVEAAPMLYTFEGTVGSISDDAGIAADWGVSVGDPVSLVFIFDFERQGYFLFNDGTTEPYLGYETFYSNLVSGGLLDEKDGGINNASDDVAEFHYGFLPPSPPQGLILGGSADHLIVCQGPASVSNMAVGDLLQACVEIAFDSNGLSTSIDYPDMVLTSINPVPIPSTLWLLGSALIGLIGFRRRVRKEA